MRGIPGGKDNMKKDRWKNGFWEWLVILHDESSISQSLPCKTLVLDDVNVVRGKSIWEKLYTIFPYEIQVSHCYIMDSEKFWKEELISLCLISLIQTYLTIVPYFQSKTRISCWDCILWKASLRNVEVELRIFLCGDRHVIFFLMILCYFKP